MYYCFVAEDLNGLPDTDPMYIQFNYAKRIEKALLCDLSAGSVSCPGEQDMHDLRGCRVMLRSSCGTFHKAAALLAAHGAEPVETAADQEQILRWYELGLTRRSIIPVTAAQLESGMFLNRYGKDLTETLFVKTKEKGFSLQLSTERLRNPDDGFAEFIKSYCPSGKEELLVSPWCRIKEDSLGPVEARFFVIDGRILNSSRFLHSLKHTVPKTLRRAAEEIVEKISGHPEFPSSYVLDTAMFPDENGYAPDIEEINPLSTAMCYVNNSIFDTAAEECRAIRDACGWGYEYCLDAVSHPEAYRTERAYGETYRYAADSRFTLL